MNMPIRQNIFDSHVDVLLEKWVMAHIYKESKSNREPRKNGSRKFDLYFYLKPGVFCHIKRFTSRPHSVTPNNTHQNTISIL